MTCVQVYIFEIVDVVPDTGTGMKRWWRLKLLCRDDAKGPVTSMCGINGYLVSSMGQKVCAHHQGYTLTGQTPRHCLTALGHRSTCARSTWTSASLA